MKILEIFNSIDGEGLRAGELASFIRTAGCNLHCGYCDTAYSIPKENKNAREMEWSEITALDLYHNVTLTGGEPLLQPDIWKVAGALARAGYAVNIETNGSLPFLFPHQRPGIMITADWKTAYSGMRGQMNKAGLYTCLGTGDVLKAVCGSEEDLGADLEEVLEIQRHSGCWVYLSPCWGFPTARIVEEMKRRKLEGKIRVQLQLHKYIWNPNAREV